MTILRKTGNILRRIPTIPIKETPQQLEIDCDLLKRIPKILHLYWDRSPMSILQLLTPLTFHNENPEWEINLYIPKQNYSGNSNYIPDYTGEDYFPLVKDLPFVNVVNIDIEEYGIRKDLHNILRSDIFRYHKLYEDGGVWSDFDVIWLKPIKHINDIEHVNKIDQIGMTVCFNKDSFGHHSIGILISEKNHLFYKHLIEQADIVQKKYKNLQILPYKNQKQQLFRKEQHFPHQSFGVVLWEKLGSNLIEFLNNYDSCLGIKYSTFYPYSIYDLKKLYLEEDMSVINKDVLCVHWFNGHELSKEYINNRLFNKKCSMSTIINSISPDFKNIN